MCFGLINGVPEIHRKNSGGYKIKTRKVKTQFLEKTTSSQRDKTTHRFRNDDHLVTRLHSFVKRNNLSYCNNHLLNAEEVVKEKKLHYSNKNNMALNSPNQASPGLDTPGHLSYLFTLRVILFNFNLIFYLILHKFMEEQQQLQDDTLM